MIDLTQPVAALLGAALSAFIALMVVIITKEQKVSEFRQAWINALRDDIGDAISAASALSVIMPGATRPFAAPFWSEWSRLAASLARIDLRLNANEALHKDLEVCLADTAELVRKLEMEGEYEREEWVALQERVVAVARPLLKTEWNRVRESSATLPRFLGVTSSR